MALLLSAAVTTWTMADPAAGSPGASGPSDTVANGVKTGTTTTGSTPPSPKVVAAPNSPAAASSGAVYTSPNGTYKGTGSSPQNQATGDAH
jgi:hypothetical protein